MKKSFSLFFAAILPFMLLAQQQSKNSLQIKAGASVSVGWFHKSNLTDNNSGFANTGEAVSVSWNHQIKNNWGLLFSLEGQRNPLNKKAFESSLNKTPLYTGIFVFSNVNNPPVLPAGTLYPNWQVKKSAWLQGSFQAGAVKIFPLTKSVRFLLGGTVGLVYARSAALSATSQTDTVYANIQQDSKTGWGFGWTSRAGIEIPINKKIFFSGAVMYAESPDFRFKMIKSVTTILKGQPGSPGFTAAQSMQTADGKQTMESICVVAGLGFYF